MGRANPFAQPSMEFIKNRLIDIQNEKLLQWPRVRGTGPDEWVIGRTSQEIVQPHQWREEGQYIIKLMLVLWFQILAIGTLEETLTSVGMVSTRINPNWG